MSDGTSEYLVIDRPFGNLRRQHAPAQAVDRRRWAEGPAWFRDGDYLIGPTSRTTA